MRSEKFCRIASHKGEGNNMTLQNGGLDLILDLENRYSSISRLRDVIANFHNNKYSPSIDLLGLSRNLDSNHYELFLDILSTMRNDSTPLGECGITVINNIYSQMIAKGWEPWFPAQPDDWEKVCLNKKRG